MKSTLSACLGGLVIVRVLEGSGRVGVEDESGRSVDGVREGLEKIWSE